MDGDGGGVEVDDHPDEVAEPVGFNDGGAAAPMGGEVEVGGKTWKRVESMGVDVRIEEEATAPKAQFELRNMDVNDNTTELEFFDLMLPVPLSEMLEVVKL